MNTNLLYLEFETQSTPCRAASKSSKTRKVIVRALQTQLMTTSLGGAMEVSLLVATDPIEGPGQACRLCVARQGFEAHERTTS